MTSETWDSAKNALAEMTVTSAEPEEMSAEERDSDMETEKNAALEDSTEANVTNEAESDLNVEAKGLTDRTNAEA